MSRTAPARPRSVPRGFSLIELIIVVAIMTILAGAVTPVVGMRLKSSRDARRLQDVQAIVKAIEEYMLDTGTLPNHDREDGSDWDTTLDGTFLSVLVTKGYLREQVRDPINDATFHYRYYHYPAGYDGFTSDFFVIGILNFETKAFDARKGYWKGGRRDWSQEFAYVIGGTSQ